MVKDINPKPHVHALKTGCAAGEKVNSFGKSLAGTRLIGGEAVWYFLGCDDGSSTQLLI